jgi:7-carboxy-7-deazaguanine synthase
VQSESSRASLRISEIFYSLQGEASRVGWPTVFVRLTGCPLRCRWCDTEHAFTGGNTVSIEEIIQRVGGFPARRVCVTGGEPLAQKNCLTLLEALGDAGFDVSLETSGALDISQVDKRISIVMDLKAPSSGEVSRNFWGNLANLGAKDEIKIVVATDEDYAWVVEQLAVHHLDKICPVLVSPAQGLMAPDELAKNILDDGLPVRFQLQLHKILWGNARGK